MEINGVTIQMLPAASGDCIYLEFPDPDFRILIDGGYAKTYHKYLKKFLLNLAAEGKRLNLIVVTHIDNDHINGIKSLLQENGNAKNPQIIGIDEIWFNGLDQCIGARKSEQTMTFSLEFIKNTKVKYYLLSTDGNRYGHPGKAVIANIIKHTENNTKLIKNYNVSLLTGLGELDESYNG